MRNFLANRRNNYVSLWKIQLTDWFSLFLNYCETYPKLRRSLWLVLHTHHEKDTARLWYIIYRVSVHYLNYTVSFKYNCGKDLKPTGFQNQPTFIQFRVEFSIQSTSRFPAGSIVLTLPNRFKKTMAHTVLKIPLL